MTEYVDQAVRKIRRDGLSLRRAGTADETTAVCHLDDGTPLRRTGSVLARLRRESVGYLQCLLAGHRFDGRRKVDWADEQTPAIECTRCRVIRARPPTGADVEGGSAPSDAGPSSGEVTQGRLPGERS